MNAPEPAPHVVTVQRGWMHWPEGYFAKLIGCRIAFMLEERGVYGTLLEATEDEESVTLVLEDVAEES